MWKAGRGAGPSQRPFGGRLELGYAKQSEAEQGFMLRECAEETSRFFVLLLPLESYKVSARRWEHGDSQR